MIAVRVVTDGLHDGVMAWKERTGLITIRIWWHDEALIARVTLTPDVDDVPSREYVVTSTDQVRMLVTKWLEEFSMDRPAGQG